MAKRRTIPYSTVRELYEQGHGIREIARMLGRAPSSIHSAIKALNLTVARDTVTRTVQHLSNRKIDAMDQLFHINECVTNELNYLQRTIRNTEEDKRAQLEKRVLRHTREIRGQLRLFLKIAKTLYDVEQVAEFQKIVLEEIGKADEETRQRILEKLDQRRTIGRAVSVP